MRRHKSNIGLRRYQRFFGFPITEIKGKKLLDVGSARAQFHTEAEKVGATVTSVDPAYQQERVRQQLKDKTRKFAARVQKLPFNDSAFDIAFARRVIPDKVSGIERYKSIAEMLRVVRTRGWIGIGPFTEKSGLQGLRTIRNLLRRSGFEIIERKIKARVPNGTTVLQIYLRVHNTGNIQKLANLIKFTKNS